MTSTLATVDIVAEYEKRYRNPYLQIIETRADRNDLESIKDTIWYQTGLYDELGYDRHGRSYRLIDSASDDFEQEGVVGILAAWKQSDIDREAYRHG